MIAALFRLLGFDPLGGPNGPKAFTIAPRMLALYGIFVLILVVASGVQTVRLRIAHADIRAVVAQQQRDAQQLALETQNRKACDIALQRQNAAINAAIEERKRQQRDSDAAARKVMHRAVPPPRDNSAEALNGWLAQLLSS